MWGDEHTDKIWPPSIGVFQTVTFQYSQICQWKVFPHYWSHIMPHLQIAEHFATRQPISLLKFRAGKHLALCVKNITYSMYPPFPPAVEARTRFIGWRESRHVQKGLKQVMLGCNQNRVLAWSQWCKECMVTGFTGLVLSFAKIHSILEIGRGSQSRASSTTHSGVSSDALYFSNGQNWATW